MSGDTTCDIYVISLSTKVLNVSRKYDLLGEFLLHVFIITCYLKLTGSVLQF